MTPDPAPAYCQHGRIVGWHYVTDDTGPSAWQHRQLCPDCWALGHATRDARRVADRAGGVPSRGSDRDADL